MLKIKNDVSKYIKRSKLGETVSIHRKNPKKISVERKKEIVSRLAESTSFYVDIRTKN